MLISILQTRKLKHREVKSLASSCRAQKCRAGIQTQLLWMFCKLNASLLSIAGRATGAQVPGRAAL